VTFVDRTFTVNKRVFILGVDYVPSNMKVNTFLVPTRTICKLSTTVRECTGALYLDTVSLHIL